MSEERSTLALLPRAVPMSLGELHVLDLVINGVPLRSALGRDLATILTTAWPHPAGPPLDVLRGTAASDLADEGRIPLLVCQECADLGCGVLSAALELQVDAVQWSDFRWCTGYDDDAPVPELPTVLRFDRTDYEVELDRAEAALHLLPDRFTRSPRPGWFRRRRPGGAS